MSRGGLTLTGQKLKNMYACKQAANWALHEGANLARSAIFLAQVSALRPYRLLPPVNSALCAEKYAFL
jgi:hypothetical protein